MGEGVVAVDPIEGTLSPFFMTGFKSRYRLAIIRSYKSYSSLKMKEEDKEMYVSMFERGYTAIGKEEGRMEGRLEIAKKLLKRNRPIDEIMEDTTLTREEIEELRVTL